MKKIVIGLAGGTGSGKTTLAKLILEDIKKYGSDVVLIEQDSYYKDNQDMTYEERSKLNYDHPDSIDFDLLISHIKDLKEGKSIDKPTYDFTTHLRNKEAKKIFSQNIIIVEGILLFAIEELRDLFDMRIFVDTDDDIRLLRRMKRDMEERGRTFESIEKQYLKTVKPMHLEFVEPSKRYADVIIPQWKKNKVGIKMVTSRLKYLIDKASK